MEARCAEAAKLRQDGYAALNSLRLEQAKRAYRRSLELDPQHRGALYQLDIIDALASDKQVGTSQDNDALYSNSVLSPCQKYEAERAVGKKPKLAGPPEAVQNGQIISFAKGDATDKDMLSHSELRATTTAALGAVLACYKSGLADNPGLRGDVTAKLQVEADGHVSAVFLESNTVEEATVERCIENVFARLQFPKRKGSHVALNVLVPLTLQPAEAADTTPIQAARR